MKRIIVLLGLAAALFVNGCVPGGGCGPGG